MAFKVYSYDRANLDSKPELIDSCDAEDIRFDRIIKPFGDNGAIATYFPSPNNKASKTKSNLPIKERAILAFGSEAQQESKPFDINSFRFKKGRLPLVTKLPAAHILASKNKWYHRLMRTISKFFEPDMPEWKVKALKAYYDPIKIDKVKEYAKHLDTQRLQRIHENIGYEL